MSRIEKVREWVRDIGDHVEPDCKIAFIYDNNEDSFFIEIEIDDSDFQNGVLQVNLERSDFTPRGYHQLLDQLTKQINELKK